MHQNNKVTKNEPRAVGRRKKYKSCFGFVCMVFGKVSFYEVRIAAKMLANFFLIFISDNVTTFTLIWTKAE